MGLGVFLLILGAIFTFAVRGDTEAVDLQTVGLILMVGGGLIIYATRNGKVRRRKVMTVDDNSDPDRPVHTVYETVVDQDPGTDGT